ncbi:MAG: aminotransferase [Mycobacteriales bacterium]|jgi:aspartate aminotransferase/aminotransferase
MQIPTAIRPPAQAAPPSAVRTAALMEDIPQALSIQFNNLVYELRASGQDIITLSLGEAFFDLPLPTFDRIDPAGLHHYSHSRGLIELRRRLSRYYRDEFSVPVDPDSEILVTAGSKAAIYMTLLAVLEPGDEVIIPEPFWLSYPAQVRLCHGQPVMVPHDVSVYDLGRYVTPRTRAIVINNPNNPSGHVYSADELRQVHALAEAHGLLLIADEAYNEFVGPGTDFVACGALDPDKHHTVTINSMSKNYGVSGWRVGYVIAHQRLVDQILKINQHLVTCAPTILSWYLAEHFDDIIQITRPQIQRVVALRNRVAGWLTDAGIEAMPGSAAFYLFASIGNTGLTSTEFATRLLRDSGVCVVPGIAYGDSCDRYIRISVGSEPEDRVARGVAAIGQLIAASRPAA